MGSCCRGRTRPTYSPNDATPCKEMEQSGSGTLVWVMNIRGQYRVVIKRTSGEFVTAESFVAAYGCSGPTASLVKSGMDRIAAAANQNPAAFQRFAHSGTSLVQLFRTADDVLKQGSVQRGQKLHSHTSR